MAQSFRTATLVASFTILCFGASGYTSGCGGGDAPGPLSILVDPRTVNWTVAAGETETQSSSVAVTQAEGLAASIQYENQAPAEWLSAEITMSGTSFVLLLSASPQGLTPGDYVASVSVTADEHKPGVVTAVLTVTP